MRAAARAREFLASLRAMTPSEMCERREATSEATWGLCKRTRRELAALSRAQHDR